jgi:hypothetical protein
MPIARPERSAYEAADTSFRMMLDDVVETMSEYDDWTVRKAAFLDIVEDMRQAIDFVRELDDDSRTALAEALDSDAELLLELWDGADGQTVNGHAVNGHGVLGSSAEAESEPVPRRRLNGTAAPAAVIEDLTGAPGHHAGDADDVSAAGDDDNDLGDDESDGEPINFLELLPLFTGAVLEKLEEDAIHSAEQAAIYMLSCHPEHQDAVEAWMLEDARHAKAMRKLISADTRFGELLRELDAYEAELAGDSPETEH